MSSFLQKIHDNKYSKYIDPVGWSSQDMAHKSSTALVNESSRAMQSIGDKWGWNTKIPEKGKELSEKDKNSFGRWGENTLAGIATFFGASYGGEYLFGGAGAGGGAGGNSAAGLTYLEAGGGSVTSGANGSLTWVNANGTTGAAAGNGGWQWSELLDQGGQMSNQLGQSQQNAPDPIEESEVDVPGEDDLRTTSNPYAQSSRKSKTGTDTPMSDIAASNNRHPIDTNGLHIGAIKALSTKVDEARERLTKLKEKA